MIAPLAAVAALVAIQPTLASAQLSAPSGVSLSGQALVLSERLGGATSVGGHAAAHFGLSPSFTLEIGSGWSGKTRTTDQNARAYTLLSPSTVFRARLAGGPQSGVDFILGAGALWMRSLEGIGSNPAEQRVFPHAVTGLAFRHGVVGPFVADFNTRFWLGAARRGELTASPARRGFSVTPEIRLGLAVLWRRTPPRAPVMAVDLQQAAPLIPRAASSIAEPIRTSNGRDFAYAMDAQAVLATPGTTMSVPEFLGEEAPRSLGSPNRATGRRLAVVYFSADSRELSGEYRTLMRQLATYLERVSNARFELQSFAELDQQQPDATLLGMAERRGSRVKQILTGTYGVAGDRVVVTARGGDFAAKDPRVARRVEIWAVITPSPLP